MKELLNHQVIPGVFASIKLEDGKLKIAAEADLGALVDEGAKAIPGDSMVEGLVVQILKEALKSI